MATPTIAVDSATGSDTAASGAGPATALSGTANASTDAAGTTVTLPSGTDLSGVATDGTHVIYLADATAGARNFSAINGSAGSGGATPTVTVANAFGINLTTKSWAIGGKRATIIQDANSRKLLENNSAVGDAMAGWIIEMASAHGAAGADTLNGTATIRRGGDTTAGRIELRGASGAATKPILTFSNNGNGFSVAYTTNNTGFAFKDFELQNTNATKTASVAINCNATNFATGSTILVSGMKIADSTNKFWKGITQSASAAPVLVENSDIGSCANNGIEIASNMVEARNCRVHDCGNHGVAVTGTTIDSPIFDGCIFAFNAADGVNLVAVTGSGGASRGPRVTSCTFHGNTGDGLEIASPMNGDQCHSTVIRSNCFTNNGGYGINFSGSGISDIRAKGQNTRIDNNLFNGNTSGTIKTLTIDTGTVNADPSGGLTSATKDYAGTTGGSNFMVGTQAKALGFPLAGSLNVGGNGNTTSYEDIGAAQRIEPSAGSIQISMP